MGYWSKHPMAGDAPLDAKGQISSILFSQEELSADMEFDEQEFKRRLMSKIPTAMEIEYCEGQTFVLPFLIAELGIIVENLELSQQLKQMIGDGGAVLRGYPTVLCISDKYRLNYGGFTSPLDYANQLRDAWDYLMAGHITYNDLEPCKGLLESLYDHMSLAPISVK